MSRRPRSRNGGQRRQAPRPLAALWCGALVLLGACTPAPPAVTTPPAAASPAPEPPAAPATPVAPPLAPLPAAAPATVAAAPPVAVPAVLPAVVRIGLATDLEAITLPCCEGELSVEVAGERLDLVSPLRIRPTNAAVGGVAFRVQVAALHDDRQANELARRLGALSGLPSEARFDAQAGLYRVRLGRFAQREEAESAARGLARFGVDSSWVVSEGAALEDPALELTHHGRSYRIEGRRFALAAPASSGVRWEGRRYRGRLEVFLNSRGRLNLINELPIEEYLRGVVPRELGPNAYPELEALKAQAIAARSYTLRNLGEFADEGYDLCGTPRCQVYGGMDDEHPLSDRAVAETAGLVLVWDGQPIDALYSATCGGHTENVEIIFPLKRAPYLRGVPCIEAGAGRLVSGSGAATGSVAGAVLAALLPGEERPVSDALALQRALTALA
ncbi:MAG: SpoIID/LytB domain-containing protein, partial [Thermoanaerobaculia bacterium]